MNATHAERVAEAVQELVTTTGEIPQLIVIDTMARNFVGDENSATDVGHFVTNLDRMRRHWDTTVMIVHHSGKASERGSRGSSALKGAVDAEYELKRDDNNKLIQLIAHKMKDADHPSPLMFELVAEPVWLDNDEVTSSAVLRLAEGIEPTKAVIILPGKHPRAALEELIGLVNALSTEGQPGPIQIDTWRRKCEEAVGMERKRFHDAKKTLAERGLIRIDGNTVDLGPSARSTLEVPGRTDDSKDSHPAERHLKQQPEWIDE
ncbi:AAA domain protein [compost metagenome]